MDKFTVREVIGADRFGGFYRCLYNGNDVLVKTIFLKDGSEGVPLSIISKISLLREMEHPKIARLLEVVNEKNDKHVYQVFEYAGLDLKKFIKNFPGTARNPQLIKSILHQILHGISYYHSNKFLHGRLTPYHVLINLRNRTVKLTDIGMNVAPSGKAPEILLGSNNCSFPVDVWSVGCIFAEMVIQQPLFNAVDEFHERSKIFWLMGIPTEETWPGVNEIFEFLHCYTKSEPKDLTKLLEGLEPAGVDLLLKMLCVNPSGRITVDEALKHDYFKDVET